MHHIMYSHALLVVLYTKDALMSCVGVVNFDYFGYTFIGVTCASLCMLGSRYPCMYMYSAGAHTGVCVN